jgi:hypothetical protein
MHTEPIETYRGVLIYHDMPQKPSAEERAQFRCMAQGKWLTAETKASLREQIDRILRLPING